MRYCKTCVMPDTKPGITFNSNGICSACQYVETKDNINWEERERKLEILCNSVRGITSIRETLSIALSGYTPLLHHLIPSNFPTLSAAFLL